MTAKTFSPGTKGIMTNLVKLIRREQVEMLLPWWTASIWSALLRYPYIQPRKMPSHGRIFPCFCYLIMKFTFLGFHVVVLVKTFPLMYQLPTNVGLTLTKLGWFLFLRVRTDRHGFGILTWKHVGTQKISTQSSKLVVSRRFLYASPEVGDIAGQQASFVKPREVCLAWIYTHTKANL